MILVKRDDDIATDGQGPFCRWKGMEVPSMIRLHENILDKMDSHLQELVRPKLYFRTPWVSQSQGHFPIKVSCKDVYDF